MKTKLLNLATALCLASTSLVGKTAEAKILSDDRADWSEQQKKDYEALNVVLDELAEYYFSHYKPFKTRFAMMDATSEYLSTPTYLDLFLKHKDTITLYMTTLVKISLSLRNKHGFLKEDKDLNRTYVDFLTRGDDSLEVYLADYVAERKHEPKVIPAIKTLGPSLARQVLKEDLRESEDPKE